MMIVFGLMSVLLGGLCSVLWLCTPPLAGLSCWHVSKLGGIKIIFMSRAALLTVVSCHAVGHIMSGSWSDGDGHYSINLLSYLIFHLC